MKVGESGPSRERHTPAQRSKQQKTLRGIALPVSLVGLPPGSFPTRIFNVVLNRITIRGSIVGIRKDLAEALAFAAEGKIRAHIHRKRLDDINTVLDNLRAGTVDGRVVLDIGDAVATPPLHRPALAHA